MKNEFEKLDSFMLKHRPEGPHTKTLQSPGGIGWRLPVAVAASLIAIVMSVTYTQQRKHELDLEAIAMAETLEWDMNDDFSDVTDLVALAD